jgi:putative ABC transport system permease protein
VFAAQGSNGELDLDNIGVVPYSVLDRLRGNGVMFAIGQTNPTAGNGVLLQVDDVRNLKTVESSAIQLIQQSHPPKPSELPWVASDFAEAVRTASQFASDLRLVLTGITVVALLLGAFGMFSIMTVSVTERTREIGLRMAVGARTRDVLMQFLLEAALLGLVGGCLGALLGSGLAVLATGPIVALRSE